MAANFFYDPAGAGKEFGAGMTQGILEKVWVGAVHFVDAAGFIVTFLGVFLYMLGIEKGGRIAWVSLALWFTIRIILISL